MQDKTFVPFTKKMKKEYTILVPDMLPMHFKLIRSVLKTYGYNVELLEGDGPEIAETGLKYVHNDTCYPAILVVGQFMQALLSGKYDPSKTALIMFQTGGGCRASNYLSLIRKALKKADMEYVPVISFTFTGIEKHPGFKLALPVLHAMLYAILYADLLMSLVNQIKPYELHKGDAETLAAYWTERLGREMGSGSKIRYKQVLENYRLLLQDFGKIPIEKRETVKVGVVGEIFVKYSPLGNNHLEQFLVNEGAEVVVPGLLDFLLYCVYDSIMEYKFYGKKAFIYPAVRFVYNFLCRKKQDIINLVRSHGGFKPWTSFPDILKLADGYISTGVNMGEGWLLTAEMLELAESGCKNIVCTQPFGCLPNHICGKGMMKPIKEKNPDVNIVAIDYDAGASRVNQENRLKLMLFNAKRNMQKQDVPKKEVLPRQKVVQVAGQ
ncbi:MAG: 2-hydroxyacyl-CoA dehydratase [Clostridiaceae bacterium]|nr:2-hydroxyacyl-CoA dehydratase [Clostridiaceae bacterium]